MPKFVKRVVLLGIVWVAPQLGMVVAQQGFAQDSEFPVLNTLGRYLGVGYTRAGYHAANDGRMDVVTSRHPATLYRQSGLPVQSMPYLGGAPIFEGWQAPPTVSSLSSPATAARAPATGKEKPATEGRTFTKEPDPSKSVAPEVIETPKPSEPPKPSGPPPSWLKDYLKDENEKPSNATISPKDNIETKEIERDKSPSDLLLNEDDASLIPATGVTYSIIESSFPSVVRTLAAPTKSPVVNRFSGPNLPRY